MAHDRSPENRAIQKGHEMSRYAPISAIYRQGEPEPPPDPMAQWARVERMRRQAWRNARIVAVSPDELPEPLGKMLRSWAEEHYG